MRHRLLPLLIIVLAMLLFHDGTMAATGHASVTPPAHEGGSTHHEDESLVPGDCGTVRLPMSRMSAPEPPAIPDLLHALLPTVDALVRSAISEPFLVVPVIPPPSACLARFQVFRI